MLFQALQKESDQLNEQLNKEIKTLAEELKPDDEPEAALADLRNNLATVTNTGNSKLNVSQSTITVVTVYHFIAVSFLGSRDARSRRVGS